MAVDLMTLGLAVDTTQVKQAARDLDKLSESGEKSAKVSFKISDAQREINRTLLGLGDSTAKAAQRSQDLREQQERLITATRKEADSIGSSRIQLQQYETAQAQVTDGIGDYTSALAAKEAIEKASISSSKRLTDNVHEQARVFDTAKDKLDDYAKRLVGLAAAYVGVSALTSGFASMSESMAQIDALASNTGGSIEAMSRLGQVAIAAGIGIDQVMDAATEFSKNIGMGGDSTKKTIEALEELGVAAYDVNGVMRDSGTLFLEATKVLGGMEAGSKRTALAGKAFGEEAAKFGPYFEAVNRLVGQFNGYSAETVGRMMAMREQTGVLRVRMQELYATVGVDLVPAILSLAEAFLEVNKESDKLGGNQDIMNWADSAGLAVARLFDALVLVKDVAKVVGSAFRVVWEDVRTAAIGVANLFSGAEWEAALEQRNKIATEANERLASVWDRMQLDAEGAYEGAFKKRMDARQSLARNAGGGGVIADPADIKKAADEALAEVLDYYQRWTQATERQYAHLTRMNQLFMQQGRTEGEGYNEQLKIDQGLHDARIALIDKQIRAVREGSARDVESQKEANRAILALQRDRADMEAAFAEQREEGLQREEVRRRQVQAASDEQVQAYIDSLDAQIKAQNEQLNASDRTLAVLKAEEVARYDAAIAVMEQNRALLAGQAGRDAELVQLDKVIAKYREMRDKTQMIGQNAQALDDQKRVQEAAQFLDQYLDPSRATDFGQALSEAFGNAGDAMGRLVTSMQQYEKSQKAAAKAQEELNVRLGSSDPAERLAAMQQELALTKMTRQETLSSYASISSAAKGMFDERSKGYAALQNAERVFRAFQLAEALKNMVIAAKEAILTQGKGDPYTAFARMAAMAAFVGTMVSGVGGGGGGAGVSQRRQASQSTGTVRDDPDAKSTSFRDSLDELADNSDISLRFTSQMVSILKSIDSGIESVSYALVRQLGGIRGLGGGELGGVAPMGIIDQLFGSTKTLVDAGLRVFTQEIGDIIDSGLEGASYRTTNKQKRFFGFTYSNKTRTSLEDLDDGTSDQFGLIFKGLVDSIAKAGEVFGKSSEATVNFLRQFQITEGSLSFKGMDREAVQKELEAWISSVGDFMAEKLVPEIAEFQKAGEGYMETLLRVASGMEVAQLATQQLGIKLVDIAAVSNKSGDVGAELVRESIMLQESAIIGYRSFTLQFRDFYKEIDIPIRKLNGIGEILESFEGSAEELVDVYRQLLDIRSDFLAGGLGADVNRDQIRGAGGLEQLQAGSRTYIERFLSEANRVNQAQIEGTREFIRLGVRIPQTRDEFVQLVQSFDRLNTAAGDQMVGSLLALAETFDEGLQAMEAYRESAERTARVLAQLGMAAETGLLEQGAGGMDRLRNGADAFMEELLKPSEQIKILSAELKAEFDKLGLAMPRSKDELRDLIESFRGVEGEGEIMLGALLALIPAFVETTDRIDDLKNAANDASRAQEEALQKQRAIVDDLMRDIARWASIRDQAASLRRNINDAIGGPDTRRSEEARLWRDLQTRGLQPEQQLAAAERLTQLVLERHRLEEQNAERMIDFGRDLQEYVKDLKTGDLSPLTNEQRLKEAEKQYQDTLTRARAGDVDAQGQLTTVADTYLREAREYFASSEQYTRIFANVTGQLDKLGTVQVAQGERELKAVESAEKELKWIATLMGRLETQAKNELNTLVPKLDKELDILRGMLNKMGRLDEMTEILRTLPLDIAARIARTPTQGGATGSSGGSGGSSSGGRSNKPWLDADGWFGNIPPWEQGFATGGDVVRTQRALLHQGERVQTAQQVKMADGQMVAVLTELREEVVQLRRENREDAGKLARVQEQVSRMNAERIASAQKEAADRAAWRETKRPVVK